MEQSTYDLLLEAVNSYEMPDYAKELLKNQNIIILCGVTAAGKNTVSRYLIEYANYQSVVSHTTRLPRVNHGRIEENGVDYWFVNDETMLELVTQNAFVEVKNIHGETFYGTSIMAIEHPIANQKNPVMEIDVHGALELVKAVPSLRPLFLLPPSYDMWMERLGTRGFISDGDRDRRMQSAKDELQTAIDNRSFIMMENTEVIDTARAIMNNVYGSEDDQERMRDMARELQSYI